MSIAYAGMTHLGIVSAICAAEKGFSVTCFDRDDKKIRLLKMLELPFVEPQLGELLRKNVERLHFTSHPLDLQRCEVVYIAQDVSTDDRGESDLAPLHALIDSIRDVLVEGTALVILSQVPPGFTRQVRFDSLFYQVETLIFGQAVERALCPERFIVGSENPQVPLPKALTKYLSAYQCPILPMRYESAELSKIAINMYLVSSVATTNTIAELCEKIGAEWGEIVPALRLDKRIGKHAYLSPGLGIAGGNLERDLATFGALADKYGSDAQVVRAWSAHNSYRSNWALRRLHEKVLATKKDPTIAIWGLAYKKDTNSVKNSPAIALLAHLKDFSLRVYDPVVKSLPDCYRATVQTSSALEACEGADALVIMTPWDEFRRLNVRSDRLQVVIDPFGVLGKEECVAAGRDYYSMGSV